MLHNIGTCYIFLRLLRVPNTDIPRETFSKLLISIIDTNLVYNALSFGGSVYADEQAKFYCDPGEIGIKNLCFSKFSPISFHRFWVAQIIGTSLPLIAYVVTGLVIEILNPFFVLIFFSIINEK